MIDQSPFQAKTTFCQPASPAMILSRAEFFLKYSPMLKMMFCENPPTATICYLSAIRRLTVLGLLLFLTLSSGIAQKPSSDEDALQIKSIFDAALTDGQCYNWLTTLCTKVGNRLAGSPGAEAAVTWTRSMLDTIGLDSVWLQPCLVPRWVRGSKEIVRIAADQNRPASELNALALGGSVGTGPGGLQAEIIEVQSLDELEKMGKSALRGKIVFFNRPMDATHFNTFRAYGGAVDQRVHGASRAAKFGAAAVVVRSMASGLNDWPHTGTMIYDTAVSTVKIPAVAISTNDAERLSQLIKTSSHIEIFIKMDCQTLTDVPSFNVIGELRGSVHPEKIITIGGHLDSWDVGQGAHDDGAGCVQSMDVLFLLKKMGLRPRHTIRCVLFMNEENGLRGGTAYADEARRKGEQHLAALESDSGGFSPKGFGFEADATVFQSYFDKIIGWEDLFDNYGIRFRKGGGGADIGPLKPLKPLLIGLQVDTHRYFDFHHTNNDVIENVHPRELKSGAAAMTSLVWLIDKYGL